MKREEILYIIVKNKISQLLILLVSTHCLSHIMLSFYCFEIGHVAIIIIDPLTNRNELSQSQVITINKNIININYFQITISKEKKTSDHSKLPEIEDNDSSAQI